MPGTKADEHHIGEHHGIVEDVEAQKALDRRAGAEDGGNDYREEINHDVLVGEYAVEHILKGVFLLSTLMLHVFQIGVVFFDLKNHRQHKHQKYQRPDNRNIFQGYTHLFAEQERNDHGHTDGRYHRDHALDRQNIVSLGRVVCQRGDQDAWALPSGCR